jgi:hypothetical protein
MLLLTAGLAAPQAGVPELQFDSYTKAYQAAGEAHKPMLVVLNPPAEEVAAGAALTIEDLRADKEIAPLLDKYVVAVVDTGTEHGQAVHKVFGEKQLPYVAVIDERQEKQVFTTSTAISHAELLKVLAKYKNGVPKVAPVAARIQAPGYCPNCVKNRYYSF